MAARSFCLARRSLLRTLSGTVREAASLHRRVSTDAVAAAAAAAAAPAPVAAAPSFGARHPALSPTNLLGPAREIEIFFIDTPAKVGELADHLWSLADRLLDGLYIDLEGIDLCRHGTISLLVFYAPSVRQAFFLDVFKLNSTAFTTKSPAGRTIKDILESDACTKYFFDVRNDSDALFSHFGVDLKAVFDIQLMEIASRSHKDRNFICGLATCMLRVLTPEQSIEWIDSKNAGKVLYNPRAGGSWDVFNARPLCTEIVSYCIGDVYYLPFLRNQYWSRLTDAWKQKVKEETRTRIFQSQQEDYEPHSPMKLRSPWEAEWDWVSLEKYKTPDRPYYSGVFRRLSLQRD